MRLYMVGLNHQTAPVNIREKAAVTPAELPEVLEQLRPLVPHCAIISTCNRTEIYSIENDFDEFRKLGLRFLQNRLGIPDATLIRHILELKDAAAFDHLLRVASGIESMIIGEYEILGQVKQSLEAAEKAGMVNEPLRQVFQTAIRVGRRVRKETGISRDALSVSSVAVETAAVIAGDLAKCKMVIIGAGEAGQLVGKVARAKRISGIVIASRTSERAKKLAEELDAKSVSMNNVKEELEDADIVVTCAGVPHRLMKMDYIRSVMSERPDMPLVIMDIAVPRDVEPQVRSIHNVHLYNLDDFTRISEANRKLREGSIKQAEGIIADEVNRLVTWWHDHEVKPTISALMGKAEAIRFAQVNKTLPKLPALSDEQMNNLNAMTKAIVTRMLADTIQYLKTNGNGQHSELIREVFRLDKEATE